jgi:hypothetical protein
MKTKTQTKAQPYFALANEFSLHSDGRWLTTCSPSQMITSDNFLDIATWLDARRALNLGISVYADDHYIMMKAPGATVIELIHAPDGFTG